ncbi:MAG: cobalt ECF transporter T component CbiQ [Clostridiales Family XIII bacterium]|jgi:cobalt/nickel transport system permease protein|nr:cobalt ECF transporter T component CbiQ [Clostridiales Family XIII bacterium]
MIANRVHSIYALENLSGKDTVIHELDTRVKLILAFAFVIVTVSFNRYDILGLIPLVFYPAILIPLAELPAKILMSRFLIALPFCAFAGITNAILDRTPALTLGNFVVTLGVISCITIILKTFLCVMAVFLLIATTPFARLTRELLRLHVPTVFVLLIEMIYRYLGVLSSEAMSMSVAYKLRSVSSKGIKMKHMGSFVGQLAIRSFDRGERVYAAMTCRGYNQDQGQKRGDRSAVLFSGKNLRVRIPVGQLIGLVIVIAIFILLRIFEPLSMLG